MEKDKAELLAPAGNYEGFLGALRAGADAVYLGGEKFGARAYADNFTGEEICRAVSYAHLFGRKVYLTVNTLFKDAELSELPVYLAPFCEAGLDGVIVQDMGAFLLIRDTFPALKLHVSTQMTVTGTNAAKLLKEMGADRIVPARELSLKELKKLKENTGLQLETFVHGAMCYCYSGQCLFSSILGGRSGNRGRCAQPCRLPYRIVREGRQEKEAYPLSLKDLCSISFLPKLIETGIDSFKIEGRMKKPEYAAGVTAVYRKYLDLYYEKGASGYQVEKEDLERLSALYVRSGTQEGYYFKQNSADMVTLFSPSYNGSDEALLTDVRSRYLDEPLKKNIQMKAVFQTGEKASLTLRGVWQESDTAVTVYGGIVEKANKQPITEENIRISLQKLGNTFFTAKENDIFVELSADAFYPLKEINILRRQGTEALMQAFCAAQAHLQQAQPQSQQACPRAQVQMPQACPQAQVQMQPLHTQAQCGTGGENAFGEAESNGSFREESGRKPCGQTPAEETGTAVFHVGVSAMEQLSAVLDTGFRTSILYLESDMPELTADFIRELKKKTARAGQDMRIFIALPYIIRDNDMQGLFAMLPILEEADGVLIRNMEALGWLGEQQYQGRIRTDSGVYCFNQRSLRFFLSRTEGCCIPYELNRREWEGLLAGVEADSLEKPVYGRIPLMLTANCIAKTSGHCGKAVKDAARRQGRVWGLKDRMQKEFPVALCCRHCYNIIYNAVPLSLHRLVAEGKTKTAMRLCFTTETGPETRDILQFFTKAQKGHAEQPPYKEYTLGHEKRGVE